MFEHGKKIHTLKQVYFCYNGRGNAHVVATCDFALFSGCTQPVRGSIYRVGVILDLILCDVPELWCELAVLLGDLITPMLVLYLICHLVLAPGFDFSHEVVSNSRVYWRESSVTFCTNVLACHCSQSLYD